MQQCIQLFNLKEKCLLALLFGLIIYCSSLSAQSILMDSVTNTCYNSIINIPVRVKNFKKILGIQGTISWDTAVLKYYNISYNSSAIALNTGNFNFNNITFGTITYVWTDPNAIAETIADSTILISLQFKVLKSFIGGKNISFINSPTPLEIVSIDSTGSFSSSKKTSYQMGYISYISQPTISKIQDTLYANVNGLPSYFQWNLNASPISGANGSIYTNAFQSGGNYSVTIKYTNGCAATSVTVLPIIKSKLVGDLELLSGSNPIIHLKWNKNIPTSLLNEILEKSINGIDFLPIKTFNSNQLIINTVYTFQDTIRDYLEEYFYRLNLIDNNGNISFSNVVHITLPEYCYLKLYPNPAKNNMTLLLNNNKQEMGTIEIKNFSGRTIYSQIQFFNKGLNNIPLNISTFNTGEYFLIMNKSNKLVKQFIKY